MRRLQLQAATMSRLVTTMRKAVRSLSLTQVHALSLLAFGASAMALAAPLLLSSPVSAGGSSGSSSWSARFCANLAGYASVLVPLQLAVWLVRGWDYARRGAGPKGGVLPNCIRLLALDGKTPSQQPAGAVLEQNVSKKESPEPGQPAGQSPDQKRQRQPSPYTGRWCLHMAGCFLGLQAAYLTWGVLQERMMTFDYVHAGRSERFRDSQFLVFANRALGGLLALPLMLTARRRRAPAGSGALGAAPAFEYVYSALSNILSSWCQYEALVYVTFPTQVLAKASKIIPVMLMGKLVSRRCYRTDEYFTSGLISAGTAMFLLSSSGDAQPLATDSTPTSSGAPVSGALLLSGYLVFDAFTSSWQSRLFVRYRVSSLQMMAGSSLVSCLVTVAAQLQQGSLAAALAFAGRHPLFAVHLGLLSLCSTLGQLVIYHTIDEFGPVTFIIIMTVRQAFAILISCLQYQHQLTGNAWLGVASVFGALFLRIYFANRAQRRS